MARSSVRVSIDLGLAKRISVDAAERGVRGAVIEAENVLKVMLSQPGSGRVYGNHRASAPGEPPAPDTGRLRQSIQTEVFRRPSEVLGQVSINTEYAAALELGTERMAARPFVGRLVREHVGRLRQAFRIGARIP